MKSSGVRIDGAIADSYVSNRATKDDAQPEWIAVDEIGECTAWLASDEAHGVRSSVPHLQQQSD